MEAIEKEIALSRAQIGYHEKARIAGNSIAQVAQWKYLLTNTGIYGYGRPK